MGVYDSLPNGSQVKCFYNELRDLKVGDEVPYLDPDTSSYVVLLREGGFAKVIGGKIVEIVEDEVPRYPKDFPDFTCIDKWANIIETDEDLEGTGLLGENYYWNS